MTLTTAPLPQTTMGLIARLEGTRVPLPLKAIEVAADVTGDLVSVELDQVFLQDHDDLLEQGHREGVLRRHSIVHQ